MFAELPKNLSNPINLVIFLKICRFIFSSVKLEVDYIMINLGILHKVIVSIFHD